MDYRGAIDALINAAVDVIVGEAAGAASLHATTREQGATLRNLEAMRALLGPRLDDALSAVVDETTRRTAVRYASVRRHSRYSSDPLVNEVDDADATLGKEIIAAQGRSSPVPSMGLMLALIRAEAAGLAAGKTPIAGSATPRTATGQPIARRRPLTAADIPDELAQVIFAAVRGDEATAVAGELRRLETTPVNLGAIVTKVRVALERDPKTVRRLADELRDAGVVEIIPPAHAAVEEADVDPTTRGHEARAAADPAFRMPLIDGASRPSIKDRIRSRQSGATPR